MDIFFVPIVDTIVTAIVAIVIAFFGYYYKEKHRVTELVNTMYSLLREREAMFNDIVKIPNNLNNIAYLQLQVKHLLMEIKGIKIVRLKVPQLRLFAEACEAFLYYDDAKQYWEKCMALKLSMPEVESEYHRRYAQFLYERLLDKVNGDNEYKKAIMLPNNNAGRRYINYSTYVSWINDILTYESYSKDLTSSNTKLLTDCIKEAESLSLEIPSKAKREECHMKIIELSKRIEDRKTNYIND